MQKHKYFILILITLIVFDGFLWVRAFSAEGGLDSELYFFDVGQGDSALIITSSGARILIDGGKEGSGVLRELNKVLGKDKYIDLMVMSHGDFDHFGGFLDLLDSYDIGAFIGTGRSAVKDSYSALLSKLERKKIPYIVLMEGDSILFNEEIFFVLSPSLAEILSDSLNDTSLVMFFDGENFSALFTGDVSVATERRLVRDYNLQADILKVGHHGSKTSSDLSFLEELMPLASIISVGENNYGHPAVEVLDNLQSVSQIFRTDKEGSIKVSSELGNLVFEKF